MDSRVMAERGKMLEETFFAHREKKLVERLREEAKHRATRKDLSEASGIRDETVLDKLVELGVSAQTVAALGLVPLVEMAWADHAVHQAEHDAVLRAAGEAGIGPDTPARALLDEWLSERPTRKLLTAWKDYVEALGEALDPDERKALHDDLLDRAERVAAAAGGILGVGKVSQAEKAMLKEMEEAFERD
jgi:hypothetical protein